MWIHWVLYDIHLITTQIRPGFHIYTLERSFCLILNIIIVIRHIPRCVIRHLLHLGLWYMHPLARLCYYILTHWDSCTECAIRDACSRGRLQHLPRTHTHENVMATDIMPHLIVVQNTTLTPPIKWETRLYKECHTYIIWHVSEQEPSCWARTGSLWIVIDENCP